MAARYTIQCPECEKDLSRKTVRRHIRIGCPGSERRKNKLLRSVQRTIQQGYALRGVNRHHGKRPRPTSPCPPSPEPAEPIEPAKPPRKRCKRNQQEDWAQSKSQPRSRSLSPMDEDEPLRYPDFELDTPGAGPPPSPSPVPPAPTDSIDDPLAAIYETQPWLKGLSADDIARMQAQEEIAKSGGFQLSPEDLLLAEAFNYRVTLDATGRAIETLPYAFPGRLDGFPKESEYTSRIIKLTGMKGVRIDCCVNSCIAYTGPYKNRIECPRCGAFRYKRDEWSPTGVRPRRRFLYIPLIPRLVNMYRDPTTARLLGYRARRRPRPQSLSDIFDGQYYAQLMQRRVKLRGRPLDHRYFSSPTDIALGLSTDGFGPFRTCEQSCWPLVIFNYNLDPTIRHRLENLLCLGVIPGPNEPQELDTFLEPLVDELEQLARGVAAFDGEHMRPFCLHAYLIACFGDMPAVAKMMCMKGVNGKHPCRACKIVGIRAAGSKTNYVPLFRPYAAHDEGPRLYDPLDLPRRTHLEFLCDALHVEKARTNAEENRRSRKTGINGLSTLARLGSLEFPRSFPHDFMHVMFENIIPTLISLWTRSEKYQDFGSADDDYLLDKSVWDALGKACAQSGNTIPARFGCRVPNLAKRRSEATSESMLLFATLLAPGLLRRQFNNEAYYRHFIDLVKLINMCCALSITREDVQSIRDGFAQWVRKYETLYYQKTRDRIRACTLPLHALLHIADDIEAMGPVWCYWAFPMERLCGSLLRANKSRRFPYSSLDHRVLQIAQLAQLKLIYGLREHLNIDRRRMTVVSGTKYDGNPDLVFAEPRRELRLSRSTRRKVAAYIGAYLGIDPVIVRNAIAKRRFVQWGRMQQVDHNGGGDLIRAHAISPSCNHTSRDASFVKYETQLGRYQWDRTAPQVLREPDWGYGRAERFIIIDTDFLQVVLQAADRPIPTLQPLGLALVSPIPHLKRVRDGGANLIQYKLSGGRLAKPEVIDVGDIVCLVGRFTVPIPQPASYIVDRETVVGRLDILEDMVTPD
ncbi:Transposase family Tnp2 protein [Ceratobasidium sp. AG-Ba]|nr:Transposase family Tnp2 protein [Ceratobasidium sp. AG-Ba]